ncbi:MAG TPA: hypothetical protein DCW68_00505 [Rhodospirillaceae bacterium]|nr:hypothetical protein [Rhodospirillaceae bacterium]
MHTHASCTSLLCEPSLWQARHSPIVIAQITPEGERRKQSCQRRLLDARLWNSLTPQQQANAMRIDRAFRVMSRGMGLRLSSFMQSFGSGSHENERDAETIATYFAWNRQVQKANLSHAAAMDIVVYGRSCREVDALRRKRKGWARENLGQALDLWR